MMDTKRPHYAVATADNPGSVGMYIAPRLHSVMTKTEAKLLRMIPFAKRKEAFDAVLGAELERRTNVSDNENIVEPSAINAHAQAAATFGVGAPGIVGASALPAVPGVVGASAQAAAPGSAIAQGITSAPGITGAPAISGVITPGVIATPSTASSPTTPDARRPARLGRCRRQRRYLSCRRQRTSTPRAFNGAPTPTAFVSSVPTSFAGRHPNSS